MSTVVSLWVSPGLMKVWSCGCTGSSVSGGMSSHYSRPLGVGGVTGVFVVHTLLSVLLVQGSVLLGPSVVVGWSTNASGWVASPGGCLFGIVAGALCGACGLHNASYGGPSTISGRQALVSILSFTGASLALLLTDSLLLLGLAFEAQSVPLVLLLLARGVQHSGYASSPHPSKGTGQASLLFVAYATASGVLLYVGLGGSWLATGSTSLQSLLSACVDGDGIPRSVLWCALAAGYVKVAACPTHLWLTKVHVEASTVGSTLLAGLGLKVGYYLHLALWPAVGSVHIRHGATALWVALSIGAVIGALVVCWQVDLKRWVASFSILHVQLLYLLAVMSVLGLTPSGSGSSTDTVGGSSQAEGVRAASALVSNANGSVSTSVSTATGIGIAVTYGMLGHSYVASGLFLVVGTLADLRGVRSVLDLAYDGLLSPGLRIQTLLLLLANGAYPGTALFLSELLSYIHTGAVSWWGTLVMIAISAVSLVSGIHVWLRAGARGTQHSVSTSRSSLPLVVIVTPLTVTSVLMGLGLWTPLSLVKEAGLASCLLGSLPL